MVIAAVSYATYDEIVEEDNDEEGIAPPTNSQDPDSDDEMLPSPDCLKVVATLLSTKTPTDWIGAGNLFESLTVEWLEYELLGIGAPPNSPTPSKSIGYFKGLCKSLSHSWRFKNMDAEQTTKALIEHVKKSQKRWEVYEICGSTIVPKMTKKYHCTCWTFSSDDEPTV
jgi:hypothetical protein